MCHEIFVSPIDQKIGVFGPAFHPTSGVNNCQLSAICQSAGTISLSVWQSLEELGWASEIGKERKSAE